MVVVRYRASCRLRHYQEGSRLRRRVYHDGMRERPRIRAYYIHRERSARGKGDKKKVGARDEMKKWSRVCATAPGARHDDGELRHSAILSRPPRVCPALKIVRLIYARPRRRNWLTFTSTFYRLQRTRADMKLEEKSDENGPEEIE